MRSGIWVYDIETLKNLFCYTALNIETEEVFQAVIWKDTNEIF